LGEMGADTERTAANSLGMKDSILGLFVCCVLLLLWCGESERTGSGRQGERVGEVGYVG
jgi:hypothetical protein